MRSLTKFELAHICDIPVDFERSVRTSYPFALSHWYTLRSGIPVKVLSCSLLLTGYCSGKGGLEYFAQNI